MACRVGYVDVSVDWLIFVLEVFCKYCMEILYQIKLQNPPSVKSSDSMAERILRKTPN